jgi:hypothetical protein
LRHWISSRVSAIIECRCDVSVSLARLKALSQSADIAGIARISRASWLSVRKIERCDFHYARGSLTS